MMPLYRLAGVMGVVVVVVVVGDDVGRACGK